MSIIFDPTLGLSQFSLPSQDIKLLSFCESNKLVKLKEWADELRLTQINPSSVALYRAVPEVVRLKTDSKTRFDMLESLWGPTQACMLGLSKEYLQKPLILPEKARNAAILAQALQKHLVDGYSVCINDTITQKRLRAAQLDMLQRSLARALGAISIVVLRAYQLYANVPSNLWLRAHVLYQVAEYYELHEKLLPTDGVDNAELRCVKDIYVRLVAMGSVRANQLAQHDIEKVYKQLATWSRQIGLLPQASTDTNIYVINLNRDSPPINKHRFDGEPDDRVLELDFHNISNQLNKFSGTSNSAPAGDDWAANASASGGGLRTNISHTLLMHIIESWSHSAERHQPRRDTRVGAEICIGMIDCHYHLCGAVDFQEFLHPKMEMEDSDFLSGGFESLVNSLTQTEKDIDNPKPKRQTYFSVTIVNTSPGGYCVLWQGDLPNKIEAGELVGLREEGRRSWSVGVIRWVRQLKQASQLGIQIITNQPVPYAAAVTYDMGGYSDHMRAIHVPAPIMPDQPPGLLTPAIPFQENSRVKLKQDEQNVDVRLNRCVFSTSKIRLFSFETLSTTDADNDF